MRLADARVNLPRFTGGEWFYILLLQGELNHGVRTFRKF
jgi:hypothetical protein